MSTFIRPFQDDRVPTRLSARIHSAGKTFAATVLSLSPNGFHAEGPGLDEVEVDFILEVALLPADEPSWSPKASASASRRSPLVEPVRTAARLLYLDLGKGVQAAPGGGNVGLGARFADLAESTRSLLREYLVASQRPKSQMPRGAGLPMPPGPLMEAHRPV